MAERRNDPFRIITASLGLAGDWHRLVGPDGTRVVGEHGHAARRAYASFQVMAPDLDPAQWTSYFGVAPTSSHRRGESCGPAGEEVSPSGAPWARYRQGSWSLGSEQAIEDDLLDPHIAWLIQALGLPRPDFAERLRREDADCRVFCFWDNSSGDRVPIVGEASTTTLAAAGVRLEIDEYPQQLTTIDGRKVWI